MVRGAPPGGKGVPCSIGGAAHATEDGGPGALCCGGPELPAITWYAKAAATSTTAVAPASRRQGAARRRPGSLPPLMTSQACSSGTLSTYSRLVFGSPDVRYRDYANHAEQAEQAEQEADYVNIEAALKEAMAIDGALGVSLADWESGTSLGSLGGGKDLDLDVAAAGNTEVIRAKMRTMEALRLDDTIEDILIALHKQYHLIRLLRNSRNEQGLFLVLVLDRQKANLALARRTLKQIETDLTA